MDNDDRQLGRILSRRDVLKLLGLTGASLLAGCVPALTNTFQATSNPTQAGSLANATALPDSALPACVVRPEATEGPYFVDEGLNRSDVRSDPASGVVKAGAPLTLGFNVSQVGANGCTPLEGARVEIWHCDAGGVYSDVADPRVNTKGQKFLRGYQLTDARGQANFMTIYPGWYPGRTVHIHFKVIQTGSGGSSVFTSQLFFEDALTDRVFAVEPYASRGQRDTLNNRDGIYKDQLLLKVSETGSGYAGVFDIGLQSG
ncbi:MAG TPA: intradiol ring-cleavage dioxygenase [Anaerolineales bacterium]|jgi:protocatechuate 3,4-dioxygenase beta subunit